MIVCQTNDTYRAGIVFTKWVWESITPHHSSYRIPDAAKPTLGKSTTIFYGHCKTKLPIYKSGSKNVSSLVATTVLCLLHAFSAMCWIYYCFYCFTTYLHNNLQMGSKLNLFCCPSSSQLLTTTQLIMRGVDQGACTSSCFRSFVVGWQTSFFYGFSGDQLSWILDFLLNRKQRAVWDGQFSSDEVFTSGVPKR